MLHFNRIVTVSVVAVSLTAAVASANCISDLHDAQAEYSRVVKDFRDGNASLRDLVEVQRKLSGAANCFDANRDEIVAETCGAQLSAVQERYAQVQADFAAGNATLSDLSEVQAELAAVSACYEARRAEEPTCMASLNDLQREYAALVEAIEQGEGTLGDLSEFQRKFADAMSCFGQPTTMAIGKGSVGISTSGAVSLAPASWSTIKARYR